MYLKKVDINEFREVIYLPNYQSRGYGRKAIKLLKEMYQDYDGIYIEIEKVGNGDSKVLQIYKINYVQT